MFRAGHLTLIFSLVAFIGTPALHGLQAQDIAPPRTLAELKEETLKRVPFRLKVIVDPDPLGGEHDSQVPIEDLHLFLRHGSPKEAWVNPQGMHMGRGPGWSSQRVQREVTVPWMVRMLKGDPILADIKRSGGGETGGE